MALLDGDRFEGRFRDGVHQVGRVRPDAADGQGEPAQVRRHAALPRAHRLHGAVQAVGRRGTPLQGRHRLRARGVQPRRGAAERQARRHGRLRAHHPAAAARLVARGDLPVAASSPRAPGEAAARAGAPAARRAVPRRRSLAGPLLDADDVEDLEDAPENEVEAAEEEILDQATAAAHASRS